MRSAASPGLPYLQRAEVQWPWLIASQGKNPLGGEVDSPVCPGAKSVPLSRGERALLLIGDQNVTEDVTDP